MPVLLAPMAGITDLPFRRLVARFGAGLVVSEMVATREYLTDRASARDRAALGAGAVPTAVQLAGRDPDLMAEAARRVEAEGAAIIDINMGCPAKKVTGGLAGSALMRDLDQALGIIAAVIGAVRVPVTLKCRLGWDADSRNVADLARRAAAEGIAMLTVHGRTRCQFYTGRADWQAIAAPANALDIPVVANGDIAGPAEARRALRQSGAAGVMVGRGAQGRPWILAEIAAALAGRPAPARPRGRDFAEMVLGHYEEMLGFYGAMLGARVARKHLGWYMDTAGTAPSLRREVLTASGPAQVRALLLLALDGPGPDDRRGPDGVSGSADAAKAVAA